MTKSVASAPMTGPGPRRDGSMFNKFLAAAALGLVALLLLLRLSGEPAAQALHRNVRPRAPSAARAPQRGARDATPRARRETSD